MRRVVFKVDHAPFGKARAMRGPFGSFKDEHTETAEMSVRNAWLATGELDWPKGAPLHLHIVCRFRRPQGHLRSDGIHLNPTGERAGEYATKKPDADNIAKTVMDALNNVAYYDDAQIVELSIVKLWINGPASMIVYLEDLQ